MYNLNEWTGYFWFCIHSPYSSYFIISYDFLYFCLLFSFFVLFFYIPLIFYIEASGASGATASNIACWGPWTLVFKYTNRLCTSTTIGEEMVRVEHDMTCKVAAGSLAASSKGNLNDKLNLNLKGGGCNDAWLFNRNTYDKQNRNSTHCQSANHISQKEKWTKHYYPGTAQEPYRQIRGDPERSRIDKFWSSLIQSDPVWSRIDPGSNWIRLDQTGSDWFRLVQTGSDPTSDFTS